MFLLSEFLHQLPNPHMRDVGFALCSEDWISFQDVLKRVSHLNEKRVKALIGRLTRNMSENGIRFSDVFEKRHSGKILYYRMTM